MALIPAETLEEVRTRLDIVELVSEYVPGLQRAGRNVKGRCPFHQERTPSFIVSPERQTFHCFGCGEGGDAFAFVMKIENLSFTEAAEKLAQRVGVNVAPQEALTAEQKERLKLRELLELAADFYHDVLLKSPQAEPARKYLASRHVSAASIAAFKLGYAPGGSALLSAAQKKGFPGALLVKAGLASAKVPNREYFFERLLFPIRDAKGAAAGFGGRILGEGQPKYLNSPESPVFSKGRILYGLSSGVGEVRKQRRALLMEGYMDVIAAHQHGLTTACAPLGTALTPEHAALLKRYVTEAVIVFDADSAGLNAAVRGAELLLAAGLGVRIATVPQGKDPDEHLHAFGVGSFGQCLDAARDLVEFKTELLISKERQPLSAQAKSDIAKQALASIEQSPDEVLKVEWTRRLAQRLDLPEEALRKHGARAVGAKARGGAPAAGPLGDALDPSDQELLGFMLKMPSLSALAQELDFRCAPARRLWKALAGLSPWPAGWAPKLLEALEPADRANATKLLVLVGELDAEDPENLVKKVLEKRRRVARLEQLETLIRERGTASVDPAVRKEYQSLLVDLKGSKR